MNAQQGIYIYNCMSICINVQPPVLLKFAWLGTNRFYKLVELVLLSPQPMQVFVYGCETVGCNVSDKAGLLHIANVTT